MFTTTTNIFIINNSLKNIINKNYISNNNISNNINYINTICTDSSNINNNNNNKNTISNNNYNTNYNSNSNKLRKSTYWFLQRCRPGWEPCRPSRRCDFGRLPSGRCTRPRTCPTLSRINNFNCHLSSDCFAKTSILIECSN